MIEGLKVTVGGSELQQLATSRAEYHEKRAEEYGKQAAMFADDPAQQMAGSNSNSPRDALKSKEKEHAASGSYMRFVAAHLVATEQYQLHRTDLQELGIVKGGY